MQKVRIVQIGQLSEIKTRQSLELLKQTTCSGHGEIYNLVLGFKHLKASEGEIIMSVVHDLALEAARAYEQGNITKAEQILEKMGQASEKVVHYLNELQAQARD